MKRIIYLFLMFNLALSIPLSAQIEGLAAGATTKVALEQIKSGLNDVVDDALDRADYSVAQAAIQALGVIDSWEQANTKLLNVAFDRLDESTRNMFASTSALVDQAGGEVAEQLEVARQITENANQISESIIGSQKRSFVLRYHPMIVQPVTKDSLLLRVRGVNLDKANPRLVLNEGLEARMSVVGPQEVNFWIPLAALSANPGKPVVHKLRLVHETRDGSRFIFFPKYKSVERELLIGTLPQKAGSYQLSAVRSFTKIERRIHTQDMGRFRAKNESVFKVAHPPSGYKWDLREGVSARDNFMIVSTGSGEAGRCQDIDWNRSNEHGITGRARLDEIRQVRGLSIRYGPGYKHCGIRGPIYREVPATENVQPSNGDLLWSKDKVISLPTDVSSFTLRVNLYTGEEKVITNTYNDDFLQVIKEPGRLIVRTKVPDDIML